MITITAHPTSPPNSEAFSPTLLCFTQFNLLESHEGLVLAQGGLKPGL